MLHTTDTNALVFDFDGTLSNWHYDITPMVIELLKQYLAEDRYEELELKFRSAAGYACIVKDMISPKYERIVMDEVHSLACKQVLKGTILPDSFLATMRKLSKDWKLFILSGRDPVSLELALHKTGIFPLITDFQGHDGKYLPKPSPESLIALMSKHGLVTEDIVYVGDKASDQNMAIKARAQFVAAGWLRNHLTPKECETHCTSFEDLPSLLSNLKGLK